MKITVRADVLEDRLARMRWYLAEFEKYARKYYRYTEFVVIDITLTNFCTLYNCDFKVYMKGRSGNYGPLFLVLADDAQDRNASRVIPYVTLPISNPEKEGKNPWPSYVDFQRYLEQWKKRYWKWYC